MLVVIVIDVVGSKPVIIDIVSCIKIIIIICISAHIGIWWIWCKVE